MHLSHIPKYTTLERKYVRFCSKLCIVGYGTGALWDLWDWLSGVIYPPAGARRLGFSSLSDKTSYHQISWNLKAAKFDVVMILSLWNLTSISAAVFPRCQPKFKTESRGFETYGKTSVRLANRGPVLMSAPYENDIEDLAQDCDPQVIDGFPHKGSVWSFNVSFF